MYTHITRDDRAVIAAGLRLNKSYTEIGESIRKDTGTVWREIKRNLNPDGTYDAWSSDRRSRKRRQESKIAYRKIESDSELSDRISKRMHPLVSPEVIAHDEDICFESIYTWIYRSRPDLKTKLPQRGRKRRRYGTKREVKQGWTRDVHRINERSEAANKRSRTRHYEGDTIRGSKGALLTHTDRKSRFEIVHNVPNEGADPAYKIVVTDKFLKDAVSITYDRGSTFSLWKMVERETNVKVFFAEAHHPWERGTNENSNQRLRRVFPKGTDFSMITDKELSSVVWMMNHTKRKCLNWRTPCEMFGKCCTST
jgi:IS30 family transposase